MRRFLALTCSLALIPAIGACGGDDESEDGGGSGGAAPTERTPKPGSAGGRDKGKATAEVEMSDIAFKPRNVTVKKGGTVRWTNEESVPHDVTKTGGPGEDFSSGKGNMQKGDTFERSFPAAGKIEYVCTVHPGMTGSVTVK